MHSEEKGAFTGEVSPLMLKDVGVTHVLIGHSERRHVFQESQDLIHKKLFAAIAHGFNVIYCVGETLDEREQGKTRLIIREQIEALRGLKDLENVSIAYEPVWAIGTGKTATPEQASEEHTYIRMLIAQLFSKSAAESIRILYGGSVTPENIVGLLAKEQIDGALVGGASLDVKNFIRIAQA
ncbi:MAG: triose-phosphate isomerase, partial [Nanoarchaeota archaeon]|nr:triose-phosphate isomerase [Nanoarchaeota archaeon]